jgi:hypothetical protein
MTNDNQEVLIDVSALFDQPAKIADLSEYVSKAKEAAGSGKIVVITGQGPIWLYLKIAHALHGVARKLIYRSPAAGDVIVFDHDPY